MPSRRLLEQRAKWQELRKTCRWLAESAKSARSPEERAALLRESYAALDAASKVCAEISSELQKFGALLDRRFAAHQRQVNKLLR